MQKIRTFLVTTFAAICGMTVLLAAGEEKELGPDSAGRLRPLARDG